MKKGDEVIYKGYIRLTVKRCTPKRVRLFDPCGIVRERVTSYRNVVLAPPRAILTIDESDAIQPRDKVRDFANVVMGLEIGRLRFGGHCVRRTKAHKYEVVNLDTNTVDSYWKTKDAAIRVALSYIKRDGTNLAVRSPNGRVVVPVETVSV